MAGWGARGWGRGLAAGAAACTAYALILAPARADTLEGALVQAYQNNPTLNAQRASVRATDENVPQALAGYRPRVTASGSIGTQYWDTTTRSTNGPFVPPTTDPTRSNYTHQSGQMSPYGGGVTVTQILYNGFQTANRTRQAEGQVQSARETLRVTEQTVLLNAVTAYMNLLRDAATLDLQRRNVEVLQEQLRQTRDRFNVGEVTRTDVAQSESRLANGRSQVLSAEALYNSSVATYRQVIGVEPGKLSPGAPVDRFSPGNLPSAVSVGTATHPAVTTAQYNVDVALQAVKVAEGALYPSLTLNGQVQQNNEQSLLGLKSFNALVFGQLSVPIYQGGSEYATIRQNKETLGQRRLDLDTARDSVRQNVVKSWGDLEAAKANIEATQAQVQASEIALNGVREEARVGQRTTLDVLNAQQELVNARVALVTAQRDRVVFSYALLAAIGRLSPQVLSLRVPTYDSAVHYHQVRDSWAGVRTPDGR
jgi:outer membrane protein